MECKHSALLRHADGVLRCLLCGAEVPAPVVTDNNVPNKPKPAPKRGAKKKAD